MVNGYYRLRAAAVVMLVGACLAISSSEGAAMAKAVPTVEHILIAWKARQDRTRSARLELKETELIPKGTTRPPRPDGEAITESVGSSLEWLPHTDTSVECCWTLLLSGKMLRMTREGSYWHSHRAAVLQDRYDTTFDGEVARSFFDETTSIGQLKGFIEKDARNPEFSIRTYLPMALAFRPCDLDMGGLDLKHYMVNATMDTIDGRACVVLSPDPPSLHGEGKTLWLDPQRDFLVVRSQDVTRNRGNITIFDISYKKDQLHGWVPSEWKWICTGGISGRLFGQAIAKVTRYTVNTEILRSEFLFEFPVGTYVSDLRKADIERYIVREAGERRLVTNAELERGADYKELLSTESGMGRRMPTRWGGGRSMILIVSVSAIAIYIAALWLRRFRRIRSL